MTALVKIATEALNSQEGSARPLHHSDTAKAILSFAITDRQLIICRLTLSTTGAARREPLKKTFRRDCRPSKDWELDLSCECNAIGQWLKTEGTPALRNTDS